MKEMEKLDYKNSVAEGQEIFNLFSEARRQESKSRQEAEKLYTKLWKLLDNLEKNDNKSEKVRKFEDDLKEYVGKRI
jgi:hypothetical protein